MSLASLLVSLLGVIISAVLGRFAWYWIGRRGQQRKVTERERDDLKKQVEAEQDVPTDPRDLAAYLRKRGEL